MSSTSLTGRLWRDTQAYDLAIRWSGSIWFLLLAAVVGGGTITNINTTPWPKVLSSLCLSVFYLILWYLIIARPPAKSQAIGWLPRLAAFVGTYLPWTITFVAPANHGVMPNLASAGCVVGGTLLMLITIWHLGRSFSLIPEARSLAQTGPYRCIRHPLYLAEEIAVFGVVLQFPSPLTVTILIAHIGVQVCRIFYEEKLLSRTLPEYRAYAESRWRLIPYVW